MVKKQEMPFLEDLVKEGHITDSDSEILRLFNENEDLKVVLFRVCPHSLAWTEYRFPKPGTQVQILVRAF